MKRLVAIVVAVAMIVPALVKGQQQPVDPHWLSVNATSKTLRFQLIAGLTGSNGALNFNGYTDGGLTLTIPTGWTVEMDFVNNDGMLPHSAIVVAATLPIPATPTDAAMSRAVTVRLSEGLPPLGKDTMRFTAAPAGEYFIVCGVPGHATAGMWIRLVVSDAAQTPTMAATPPSR
jgi:sulfocyanin